MFNGSIQVITFSDISMLETADMVCVGIFGDATGNHTVDQAAVGDLLISKNSTKCGVYEVLQAKVTRGLLTLDLKDKYNTGVPDGSEAIICRPTDNHGLPTIPPIGNAPNGISQGLRLCAEELLIEIIDNISGGSSQVNNTTKITETDSDFVGDTFQPSGVLPELGELVQVTLEGVGELVAGVGFVVDNTLNEIVLTAPVATPSNLTVTYPTEQLMLSDDEENTISQGLTIPAVQTSCNDPINRNEIYFFPVLQSLDGKKLRKLEALGCKKGGADSQTTIEIKHPATTETIVFEGEITDVSKDVDIAVQYGDRIEIKCTEQHEGINKQMKGFHLYLTFAD